MEGESVDEDAEVDISVMCNILQKMLEKAGMTKTCEEILKMMADTDRYQFTQFFKYIVKICIIFTLKFILFIGCYKFFLFSFSSSSNLERWGPGRGAHRGDGGEHLREPLRDQGLRGQRGPPLGGLSSDRTPRADQGLRSSEEEQSRGQLCKRWRHVERQVGKDEAGAAPSGALSRIAA